MDFTYQGIAKAPIETVFEVLTDYPGMADISPARKVVVEKEGDPAPNGVGTVRAIHAVGPPVRERIVLFEPPTRFAYELISGIPVKNHRGEVTLGDNGNETTSVVYTVHTEPKIPGVGHVATVIVKQAVRGIFKGIIKESERRAR